MGEDDAKPSRNCRPWLCALALRRGAHAGVAVSHCAGATDALAAGDAVATFAIGVSERQGDKSQRNESLTLCLVQASFLLLWLSFRATKLPESVLRVRGAAVHPPPTPDSARGLGAVLSSSAAAC